MAAAPTDVQMRAIRAEVGNSDPSDSTIEDLWVDLGSVAAVALAILRPRLADALNSRPVTIPGSIGVGAAPNPKYLAEQVARLEAQLATETGVEDTTGFAASSTYLRRPDRVR